MKKLLCMSIVSSFYCTTFIAMEQSNQQAPVADTTTSTIAAPRPYVPKVKAPAHEVFTLLKELKNLRKMKSPTFEIMRKMDRLCDGPEIFRFPSAPPPTPTNESASTPGSTSLE